MKPSEIIIGKKYTNKNGLYRVVREIKGQPLKVTYQSIARNNSVSMKECSLESFLAWVKECVDE